jgi:hypothetical protein
MKLEETREANLPVADLLRWMTRAEADELRPLLINCGLDDGLSDDLMPISDVDTSDRILVLAGGRRVPLRTVLQGAIVDNRPGWPLLAAYAASRTPAEQQEAADRSALRRLGIDPDRLGSAQERRVVLTFLRAQESGATISEPALEAFHEAMKRSADTALYRRAAAALQGLRESGGDRSLHSLLWRLAWFLNRSGDHEAALAVSESPEATRLQGMNRAIMAAIRASALIVLGRSRQDSGLLDKAEVSIRIARSSGSAPEIVDTLVGALRAARVKIGGR